MMRYLLLFMTVVALAACQSPGRYSQKQDSAPRYIARPPAMIDAVPKYEPYREYNSRPYTVLGKRYYPLLTGKGYEENGVASWYGQKFHGHLTSNGETYNMFAMTAAHKTLPLPSYVRVTNLDNGKQAIVRVNDRGPFHANRVIDLSYAAAMKLDYHNKGTARVKLEVIHIDEDNLVTVGKGPTVSWAEYAGIIPATDTTPITASVQTTQDNTETDEETAVSAGGDSVFIQVAAISDPKRAESISNVLSALYQVPAAAPLIDNIYKLRLGPLEDVQRAQLLLEELRRNGYPGAYTLTQGL
ncbi:septal ring lytic transglycosylase RlpA family protein [Alteromonas sp. CYL-A6]|uniref:septal ring lytic transglycosylase RlpA family protein n=1 Tax=Alteromonas nitratireducens TaxID=3390813 RepID=UPI0034B792BF